MKISNPMPNESQPTPETDNAERALGMFSCILYGPAKRLLLQHARKLERERDAARAPSPVCAALRDALEDARASAEAEDNGWIEAAKIWSDSAAKMSAALAAAKLPEQ